MHPEQRRCPAVRESLSARLDGEDAPVPADEVAAHLQACPTCHRFSTDLTSVARRTRLAPADPVPDLSAVITDRLDRGPDATPGRVRELDGPGALRLLVALAGVAQLLLALPLLAGWHGAEAHLGRELATLQLALGTGLLSAALRPARAAGLLPVVGVVALATLVTAGIDVAAGVASLAAELTHLTELVGVAALWALTRRDPPPLVGQARGRTLGTT